MSALNKVARATISVLALALAAGATQVLAAEPAPAPAGQPQSQQPVLRVCQDPNNLPFSNRALEGFENKIAVLLANELGWKIEYTFYPQRMGFIRNTLRSKNPESDTFKCDLVTGVPSGFDMGATTRPYYHSTYAMAYVKGKGLDGVNSLEDLLALNAEQRAKLRLGVFGRSPVADWLLKHGLTEQMVSYQTQSGDVERYPGEMVEKDLANGVIDVAFIWGPIAGYFAQHSTAAVPIVAIPLKAQPGIKFDFEIAMAMRFGDAAYKQQINDAIDKQRPQINAILQQYGVPLLDLPAGLTPPVAAVR
ncbi:MAG: quinoprotein dehydrogenase-associated putative ABC transporter substrate-binding protein [Massilia sp.]|nr:quinoprotein dehydrogenase-associated putative ABC transporter substrate-binding protein [Massilia sp.]